ncbi:MAG: rRNA pseudouridine synthase, partial [Bacteroidetes bacterium]
GYERKPWQNREGGGGGGYRKPYNKGGGGGYGRKPFGRKPKREEFYVEKLPKPSLPSGEDMPLNKYLAHCGIASRRKAVEFIEKGLVTVNGEVKNEPYYRIQKGDVITCEGKEVQVQERAVYLLLNKPKGIITTTDDDRGRATVLDIVDPHYPERLYPVGRLDRDTTGLLLITNDGDLAAKLTHPSHHVQKQYRIGIDKPLSPADFERIEKGVELEDGVLHVNWVRFSEEQPNHDVIELEIVEGRNRVVRRLFEALGYRVRKLDRFYFAGLTKRELQRGSFRELTQREITMLKHFTGHPSTGKKAADPETPDETPDPEEPTDD